MDAFPPVSGDYTAPPHLPLLILDEARQAVELLMNFEDDTDEVRAAFQLAGDIALRLPAAE
ncbi:hypothetical protein [Streptomyces sp. NBC_01353]|uniref:hypothetical protein n=1 Tax=Streptomyces sp. NBC_01353 TaxID=2903835 RepID=UPI002E2F1B62|nr:hypothetical protein [Streptomyces sp. NBC_01353]